MCPRALRRPLMPIATFIRFNELDEKLRSLFADLDVTNVPNLQERVRHRAIADSPCAISRPN
jgi:hypothetical protein